MEKQKTVVVGLSGGVDSAVAAFLLKKQGYKVIGAFMKNFSDTKNMLTEECNWVEEKKEAIKVAAHLKIPLVVFDFEEEYKKYVIAPMIKAYSKGLTPNPDALCNKIIKFPLFWKEAKKLGADYMAFGHYIKSKKTKSEYKLFIPENKKKDQSYFLYQLNQKDLEHALFPIGDYTKLGIRKIAKKNNFPNYNRKSTSGICFVGKVNLKDFLSKKIKPKEGNILSTEGEIIGTHPGIFYYTNGQRIGESLGFHISNKYLNKEKNKLYIAEKDKTRNTITIAPKGHSALKKKELVIINFNLINKNNRIPLNCKVRIRHLGSLMDVRLKKQHNKFLCILKKPVLGLAEGQSAVIYNGKEVLGGGEIRFK